MLNWLSTRPLLLLGLLIAIGGCTQAELVGPVTDATVTITELRSGGVLADDLRTETKATYIAREGQAMWKNLNSLQKMIFLGNFPVDTANVSPDTLYLITVTGGFDVDANGDQKVDRNATPVAGTWHAIVRGSDLSGAIVNVSALTESAYQNVRNDIPNLSDADLLARLDAMALTMLTDTNRDEQVNYADLLAWSVLANIANYQLDYAAVQDIQQAIYANLPQEELAQLASLVVGAQPVDALQVFTDTISTPIVQARCIACHVAGGVAMLQGARIVFVNNSNANHLALNHQQFVNFAGQVSDIVSVVTRKVRGLDGHGGGVQLSANSQEFADLEAYLQLLD